ncbi:DMT family transporter [Thermococcus sp.]
MNRETEGTLMAFAVLFLLGLEPVVIKANPVNPLAFASLSAIIASLLLWPVLLTGDYTGELREKPGEMKKAFLTGLFATTIAYSLFSYGTRLSTAVNSAIITRFEVFYSFLISWLILGEKITGRALLSATALFTGVFLVVAQGKRPELLKGDLLLLLTPLFWQLGHAMAKRTDYSPITIATLRNTFGGLLLLVPAVMTGFEFTGLALAEGLIIALTQSLWYSAIARINLSKATAILTPAPALTVLLSILFLGEGITPYHIAGLTLISAGTLLISREKSGVRK